MRRRKPTQDDQELAIQNDLLYPNPTNGFVTYTTNRIFKKGEVLLIKDNVGREAGAFILPENLNSHQLTIENLNPGVYTVTRIWDNKFVEGHKLVILK